MSQSIAPTRESLRGRFLVIGGMSRGGTTYLYHHLPRHPRIHAAPQKELCFFGHNYDRGEEWWLSQLPDIEEDDWIVDICGLYFAEYEKAIPRIQEFAPDARVVLSLRDPLKWIFSIYEHYEELWDTPPFQEFLEGCVWVRDCREITLKFGYGRIRETVLAFAEAFGDRVLLCDFRLLAEDPVLLLRRIEAFAGLSPFFDEGTVDHRKYHERKSKRTKLMRGIISIPGVTPLARAVPEGIRSRIRRVFEKGGDASKGSKNLNEYSPKDLELVHEMLGEDAAFYENLFSEERFLTGRQLLEKTA